MRIIGSNATAQVANASAPRRAASGGFSVDESDAPKSTQPVASLRTIGGIDALIALLQDLRRDLPDGDRLADVFTDAARWRATLKK